MLTVKSNTHDASDKQAWRVIEKLYPHIRSDIPRANAVDLHVVLTPFVGKWFRELSKGTFGGGIRRNSNTTLESEQGAYIDDLAAFQRNHVLACSLSQDPTRLEVNIDNLEA